VRWIVQRGMAMPEKFPPAQGLPHLKPSARTRDGDEMIPTIDREQIFPAGKRCS
jgi:hypothetical protein